MSQELTNDEQNLLGLVPTDGTSIGNKKLRDSLKWDNDKYWQIRDTLVDKEVLRIGTGRGGSVARLVSVEATTPVPEAPSEEVAPSTEKKKEDEYYDPILDVLKEKWSKDLRLDQFIIQKTAKQGSRETGGTWTRPDIVVVSVSNYLNLPGKYVDVITFEIKTSDGLNVTAVYEALSHLRAATKAYVIVPMTTEERENNEATINTVADEASRHGVGFIITPEDVSKYDEWEFLVDPITIQGVPSRIDDFLEKQLSEDNKRLHRKYIK